MKTKIRLSIFMLAVLTVVILTASSTFALYPDGDRDKPEWAEGVDKLVWGNAGTLAGDPAIRENIRRFEAETGIKVEAIEVPGPKLTTEWSRSLALGESTYDVISVQTTWGNPTWIENGWILPLDEVYSKRLMDQLMPSAIEAASYKGKMYYAPDYGQSMHLIYRTDLLEEAGYDSLPTDWDGFLELAKKLTVDKDEDGVIDQYGFAYPLGEGEHAPWSFFSFLLASGGKMWDEEGKAIFNSPEGLAALEYMDEMLNKSKVCPPGLIGYQVGDVGDTWKEGQIAMGLVSSGGVIESALRSENGENLDVGFFPTRIPKEQIDKPYFSFYTFVCVNANSKHPLAAKYLARSASEYVTSTYEMAIEKQPGMNMLAYDSQWVKDEFYKADIMLETLNNATTKPMKAPYFIQEDIIRKDVQSFLLGEMTAQETLDSMEKKMQDEGIF